MEEFKEVIDDEIEQIKQLWDSGNFDSIDLPQNGIFGKSVKSDKDRGISRLTATRTPKLYQYLNKKLQDLKVQYKLSGQWVLYAKYQSKGYTDTRTHQYTDSQGASRTSMLTVWTEQGRKFIHSLINK